MPYTAAKPLRKRLPVLLLLGILFFTLLFSLFSPLSPTASLSQNFKSLPKKATYVGAAATLGSAALLAHAGWEICYFTPWKDTLGSDCLFLSRLSAKAAYHALEGSFRSYTSSHTSWEHHKAILSSIPALSLENKQLLHFLEERWLAKSNGYLPFLTDWVAPSFGIFLQVHPATTHSYARNPWLHPSKTYEQRVETWKNSLPHPFHYPLILTRPSALCEYLPGYISAKEKSTLELIEWMGTKRDRITLDLTSLFILPLSQETWQKTWEAFCLPFSQACQAAKIPLQKVVCIHTLQQGETGGIRILPLPGLSKAELEKQHLFLLEWISTFGLTANRIELDRWPLYLPHRTSSRSVVLQTKEEFLSFLHAYEERWHSAHPQKTLMVKGSLHALQGLFASISKEAWEQLIACPTKAQVTYFSFLGIREKLSYLENHAETLSFFDVASTLEEVHSYLSSLLEIFSPFALQDFSSIYKNALSELPKDLCPLTSCTIHSSAMTSLAGIFRATQNMCGAPPRVLCGENTYFECLKAADLITPHATSIFEATEEDWREVDLLLAQFNPALRTDARTLEYRSEDVEGLVHTALSARTHKPLTLALDCTLDLIDSPRINHLLETFQKEIMQGNLNIICYRSGLKFDLFGMDNYCGAPLFMIHNSSSIWEPFDTLLNDPVLQTDRLSLNWFCLAYKHAAKDLELYRKYTFNNTRNLLCKIPAKFKEQNARYRVVPIAEDADAAFIDVKITGPLHNIRAGVLVGGILQMRCFEKKYPLFNRLSLGFYHPNFFIIFEENVTTLRLTLGLDPIEVDIFEECFKEIAQVLIEPEQV